MNIAADVADVQRQARRRYEPRRWVIHPLHDAARSSYILSAPDNAATYWKEAVATDPTVTDDVENVIVIALNVRHRVIGHTVIATGSLACVAIMPREVFRYAVIANAHAIIMMHNHPSGDPSPSEEDIRQTRKLAKAGKLLKVELLDHVIVGSGTNQHTSLREQGYMA